MVRRLRIRITLGYTWAEVRVSEVEGRPEYPAAEVLGIRGRIVDGNRLDDLAADDDRVVLVRASGCTRAADVALKARGACVGDELADVAAVVEDAGGVRS